MRPVLSSGFVAAGILVLGACTSTGPEPAELTSFKAEVKPHVAWRSGTGDSGPYIFSPGLWGGDYFVAGFDGYLYRLDGAKGRQVWKVSVGKKKKLAGGVGVGDGLVVVGSTKGEVMAFDTSAGKPLWTAQVNTEVLSPPVISKGTVVVRTGDSRIAGLDASDGSRKWEYIPTQQSALLIRGAFGVTVEDGVVYAGLPAGKMVALRLENGSVLWEIAIATPKGDTELERVIDVVTDPVLRDGQVCAIAYQGRIGCFEAARGTLTWARNASSVTDMATSASAFFFADDSSHLFAVDRGTGASLWKQDLLLNRPLGSPATVGKYVVAGDFEGYLHFFDQEDGRIVGRLSTDGGPISAAPVAVGDRNLVVQTREGHLYAISLR
ncbi:MAG: outer membrane protein assembly factor BamB [Betaproteobacteria bacterium]|nr:outer membrane protein assembly factor BamB [Betaproteobacteria bacterium]MBL8533613.1 outer membrane protein assembly factor BamB [Betaproteobacteria bacterium]